MIPKKHEAMIPSTPHAVGVGDGDFDMILLPEKNQNVLPIPGAHSAVGYFFSACSIPASTSGAITA